MKMMFVLLMGFVFPEFNVEVVSPGKITMHWMDHSQVPYQQFSHLFYEHPELRLAMNGGMYGTRFEPLGLYIENGKVLHPIKIMKRGQFNFSMQPQGIFLLTKDGKPTIVSVADFRLNKNINYATQSAPILIVNSKINPQLTQSTSRTLRNGVGILPDGKVVMISTKEPCTFQEFAGEFLRQGCVSALNLDGGVSNMLSPQTQIWDGCGCYGPFIGVKN